MAQSNMKQMMTMLATALTREDELWFPCSFVTSSAQEDVVSASDRCQVVKWFMTLNHEFGFYPEALFMSVGILDRFLNLVKVKPKYLKCVAVTCFYLGAKATEEDECIPSTRELVQRSGCGCSISEVHRMELCILDKFNWDARMSNPLNFLHLYHGLIIQLFPTLLSGFPPMPPPQHLYRLTILLQQCLLHHQLTGFAPSVLALALLSLDLEDFAPCWSSAIFELQKLAQIDPEDLLMCKKFIIECFSCNVSLPFMDHYLAMLEWNPKKEVDMDDDDIYDDIKCLYREDVADPAQSLMWMTCGSQATHMTSSKSLLKPTFAS